MVEPAYPFQGRELHRLERAPRAATMNDLCFVEAVDRLCESIVKGVADAADRRFDPGLSQAFGVFDRDVLGGFKRSSQRAFCWSIAEVGQVPLRAFSIRASCAVLC